PTRTQAARLPGLDLLRAAAIGWVMLYHLAVVGLISRELWLVRFGWMGVDLFFVLSGFLIAGQLLRPWARGQRPSLRRFFSRRLLRTIPAYWAVLAVYALFPMVREAPHLQPLWVFLSFTQNLFLGDRPNAFSHAWSLSVEEQFYLMLPLILLLLAIRPNAKVAIGLMAAILVLGIGLRAWFWLHEVAPSGQPDGMPYMRLIYYPTYSRLDGLLAGVAAAAVKVFRPQTWRRLAARPNLLLVLGAAGVVGSSFVFGGQIAGLLGASLGYPMLALSLVLMVVAGGEAGSVIGRRALPGAAAVATVSYSLYLSHKMVFHAVAVGLIPIPAAWRGLEPLLALVLAAPVGAALYFTVERPFLKLRDRLEGPSRSSLAPAPAAVLAPAEP
ncbi:MAG TPA: acyltransferase, partial [Caulobacteraceae bacterium]